MNKLITLRNKLNRWLWYHGLVKRTYVQPINYEAYLAPKAKYLKVAFWFGLGFLMGVAL